VPAEPAHIVRECVEGYLFAGRLPRILIFRRPPARGSVWVPISGKVEEDDAGLLAALRRELLEETGIAEPLRIFDLDWEFPFNGPDGRRWRLHGFGVELDREVEPILSNEHDAFEWVDPPEAFDRLHYEDNREALTRLLDQLRQEGRGLPPAAT
jgi:lipoyl(octanoyl) transferase